MSRNDRLSLQAEFVRKSIHLSCSVLPLLYYLWLNKEHILWLSGILSLIFLVAEEARLYIGFSAKIFEKVFSALLRENEKNSHFTGATYLFFSVTVVVFIFSKHIAIPAVLCMTIADSMAAVIGKAWGKHRFFRKSAEGSVTFFLCTLLILIIFQRGMGIWIIPVAVALTFIEAAPLKINDNFLVPLSAGMLMQIFI